MGDSRAYILRRREGKLVQVQEDDTVYGDAVRRGTQRDLAAKLPDAGAVTRMLGATSGVCPMPAIIKWEPHDAVLLCTDGVSDQVGPEALASALLGAGEPGAASSQIVDLALRTGRDNATALVVRRVCWNGASPPQTDGSPKPIAYGEHGT